MERCPACDAMVDDTGVAPGGPLRCDRCNTRFPKARARVPVVEAKRTRDDVDGLGIHPALAKRYRDRASMPPEPSEVGEVSDTDPESLPHAPPINDRPDAPAAERRPDGAAAFELSRPLPPVADHVDTRVLVDEPGTTNPGRPAPRRSHEGGPPAKAGAEPRARSPLAPPQGAPEAARPPPPSEPLPVIPEYDVTELVGKGAMGRVYRARHTTGRASAIKILAPELAARQDFIQRFEREGAAMRAVNHPGVVAVMDAGSARQPDGSVAHYICMEFVEGPPLRRSLDKGALSPDLALRYARLMIQGLGAAHARGVIHRDLKPENILVHRPDEDGEERLVLVDFGLAGMLDENNDPHPNLTKSRMTMGTVNYMAPEQRTDAKRVDQRADLYAAGVILYELLTGDLPLGRFALPTERGVPVPLSVDRCIVRALARNPDERYQVAAQFDEDLRAIEAELRRTAAQDTVIGRARGTGTTNRRAMLDSDGSAAGSPLLVPSFPGAPSAVTAWVTAAPFIKRSALYWSAGALLVGAVAGLVLLRGCAL